MEKYHPVWNHFYKSIIYKPKQLSTRLLSPNKNRAIYKANKTIFLIIYPYINTWSGSGDDINPYPKYPAIASSPPRFMSKYYFDNTLQAMFDQSDQIFDKQHEIFEKQLEKEFSWE